jgi:dephospho-CoA kinase
VTKLTGILCVGLTGGIASGKTTVARWLGECGALVVHADEVVRELTSPGGAAFDAIVDRFGRSLLDSEGSLDRKELARIVFRNADERAALEAIVHPEVRAEAVRRFARCAAEGISPIGIYDAALLVETGAWRDCDRLVVVSCSLETQRRRLREREGVTSEDAEARISAQWSLARKLAVADYVVDTDVPPETTRNRCTELYRELLADYEAEIG